MIDVLREEKKYYMSIAEMSSIKLKMSNLLRGDSYNGIKPYLVRSLYFDSISDIDFFDKERAENNRKKIRLRVYNPKSDTAKLELKAKSGSMQRKQTMVITKEDALELIKCNYNVLLKYEEKLAGYLYRKMITELYQPRCVVEYDRIAFGTSENNTRLTIDSGVRANEGYFNIFDNQMQLYSVMPKDRCVLEVKYNNFLLGYIKDILCTANKLETSVSKYVMSRRFGLGGE